MSLVAEGLIPYLKGEMNSTRGLNYEYAYRITRQALERAVGALEQIDHVTRDLELTMEVKKK